jgi:hypothetical protein
MTPHSDWINIKITCNSEKIRQLVVDKVFELCMSDELLDDQYVQRLKDKPALSFDSSLQPQQTGV